FGDPFDPNLQSGGDLTIPFRMRLACSDGAGLYLQRIASSSANTVGEIVAGVQFGAGAGASGGPTNLLPRPTDCDPQRREIHLGVVRIDFAAHRTVVGSEPGGTNPLQEIDTDQDGMNNFDDTDDDGDGTPDVSDPDEDGDGVIDLNQVLQ